MQRSLDSFPEKATEKAVTKNVYLTIPATFEKYCKDCTELVNSENAGIYVRIHCKAERCIK